MNERETFVANQIVPRGTIEKLDRYAALLVDWQARMNLVASSTLDTTWTRHFADSAQLATLAGQVDDTTVWLDIGSGAGFPALVLAMLLPGHFHLVESTTKKCRFLAVVVDDLDLGGRVTIHNARIEAVPAIAANIVTARACASLAQLFDWGLRHGHDATWLLPKGRTAAEEVANANRMFAFTRELVASTTDPDARIVVARGVRRR